ncbi:pilus assembly protein [Arthrobacter crusticola]|uniref:Pilus assembly protein n=1 Tax=Arthrobacter crusticola TaxID=2547960 RepID=A0A4R5TX60_9MICC|nr:TadE family protein [Arthrobacter crusticola]TDK25720.1 pilus assembly protein [Arthrobacter crusticola]
MRRQDGERGAVAVELAFVLPLLLLILIGSIEYGRVFFIQNSLTHAAREGARNGAVHWNDPPPRLDVEGAALRGTVLEDLPVVVESDVDDCAPGDNITVTTTVTLESMSGFLGPGLFPIDLQGQAVMRCGG